MRNQLEPWESGILCQLWHRVELNILDERPKTPQHLLRKVGRELRDMQWEYKPTAQPGVSSRPVEMPADLEKYEFSPKKFKWKGYSPGR